MRPHTAVYRDTPAPAPHCSAQPAAAAAAVAAEAAEAVAPIFF